VNQKLGAALHGGRLAGRRNEIAARGRYQTHRLRRLRDRPPSGRRTKVRPSAIPGRERERARTVRAVGSARPPCSRKQAHGDRRQEQESLGARPSRNRAKWTDTAKRSPRPAAQARGIAVRANRARTTQLEHDRRQKSRPRCPGKISKSSTGRRAPRNNRAEKRDLWFGRKRGVPWIRG